MSSNAKSNIIATLLSDARKGTFTGLITTKQGVTRGRGSAKQVYGNDTIHTVIYTGFRYANLVKRSLAALPDDAELATLLADAQAKGTLAWQGRGKKAVQVPLTLDDFKAARDDLKASFERTLDPSATTTSTSAHVYEPLVVDGVTVRGSKVYRCQANNPEHECQCRDCTGDPKAPLDGTIYLDGLHIWQTVLVPAPNGPKPASKSSGKVVAKGLIRRTLPVSAYVSYRLEPGQDWLLNAGGTARLKAEANGFQATSEVLGVLDKAS